MTDPRVEPEFITTFRRRIAEEGGVFLVDDGQLAVFHPDAARQLSAANWRGYTVPDRLVDLVRRRRSREVPWTRIRGAWLTTLRQFTTPQHNARMATRLDEIIEKTLDRQIDLVQLGHELALDALLPVTLCGLSTREHGWIRHDLDQKLKRLLVRRPYRAPWQRLHYLAAQVRAGLVIRRIIRQRAAGTRPRQPDLADPIVDLLPELGMDRALDTVTAAITAIGGPPGAAAVSLLYELARHPDWSARLTSELTALSPDAFYADPVRAAPVTHRFVKEVLRMWSPPVMLGRIAQMDHAVGKHQLRTGQPYLVSSYLTHRSEKYWMKADTFDPDRWLPGAVHGPASKAHYVPFGWAPKACIGSELGTNLLMVLAHLMSVRYRLLVPAPERIRMEYAFAVVPQHFQGCVTARTHNPKATRQYNTR